MRSRDTSSKFRGKKDKNNCTEIVISSYKQDLCHIYGTTTTSLLNKSSLRVAWILGKHKKPFSDAEIIKECMTEVMDTMFEGKQKEEILNYVF